MGAVGPAVNDEFWMRELLVEVDVGDEVTLVEDTDNDEDDDVVVEETVDEVDVAGLCAHLLSVN